MSFFQLPPRFLYRLSTEATTWFTQEKTFEESFDVTLILCSDPRRIIAAL